MNTSLLKELTYSLQNNVQVMDVAPIGRHTYSYLPVYMNILSTLITRCQVVAMFIVYCVLSAKSPLKYGVPGGLDLDICNTYSTVGRSIANILDRGAKCRGKYAAKVRYRGYGPTYHTICDILFGECATDEPFCVRWQNIFKTTPFFTQRSLPLIQDFVAIHNFLWLHNYHTISVYMCQLATCTVLTPPGGIWLIYI